MTRRGMWLLVGLYAAMGCTKSPEAPSSSAADASAVEDAAFPDTELPPTDGVIADVDALGDANQAEADADAGEYCPHPWFPPRTDGCPCNTPGGQPCTELGKVCEYFGPCPHEAYRHTCTDVKPDEGDVKRKWVALNIPCPDAGTFADAGAD